MLLLLLSVPEWYKEKLKPCLLTIHGDKEGLLF